MRREPGPGLGEPQGGGEVNGSFEGPGLTVAVGPCLAPPTFGHVDIHSSSHVHFGNKLVVNGVVHINQLVTDQVPQPGQQELTAGDKLGAPPSPRDVEEPRCLPAEPPPPWLRWKLLLPAALAAVAVITGLAVYITTLSPQEPSAVRYGDLSEGNVGFSKLMVRGRGEWLAQPPTGPLDRLRLPVPLVIITHTASDNCFTRPECMRRMRDIQMLHVEGNNWTDIGYNFLVGGDGSVYEGRGWDHQGAHTYGFNVRSVGIALTGTFNTVRPPEKQLLSTQALIAEGVRLDKIAPHYQLLAHCNVSVTLSPGEQVYKEMKKWPHFTQVPVI